MGAAIENQLSVTLATATSPGSTPTMGASSSSSMALAAAPTAGGQVLGAAVGLAAGVIAIALL